MRALDQFLKERFSGQYDEMEALTNKLKEVENEQSEGWEEISRYLRSAIVVEAMWQQGYRFNMGWVKNETPADGAAGES